jgi:hypothetical protein
MERKAEAAIEQINLLNLDFGRTVVRGKLVEVMRMIQETVGSQNREEFGRIMRGTRVLKLGNGTSIKVLEKGKIQTVAVLLACRRRRANNRWESVVRQTRTSVSFQRPKESLDFSLRDLERRWRKWVMRKRHTLPGSYQFRKK